MDYVVKGGNASGMVRIDLRENETVFARENAICAFSPQIDFTRSRSGGFLRRLARKFSSAHSPMQQITANGNNGWVMLAPPMAGTITGIDLHGKSILVAKDAFLASGQSVTTSGRIYKLDRNIFVHEHFEAVKFGGQGVVLLNAFGATEAINLLPGQSLCLHPDHLIAWEENLAFGEINRGFISVAGPGRLWLQTRNPYHATEWQDGLKKTHKSANS